jgi:hypothetical protein
VETAHPWDSSSRYWMQRGVLSTRLTPNGETTLEYALSGDLPVNLEIVQVLLENGANPNLRPGVSNSPLLPAATWLLPGAVDLLVKFGADVSDDVNWHLRVNALNFVDCMLVGTGSGLERLGRSVSSLRKPSQRRGGS